MREPLLHPGDIVLTASRGWFGRSIRACTRSLGESPSQVNHAALVVGRDPFDGPILVEALSTVKRHGLRDAYRGGGSDLAVYRPRNVPPEALAAIVRKASSYVGRQYGYGKILLHWLDWLLLGAYVFRRLGRMERYPICSYVVASAYAAGGYTFGVEPGAASPDDIWDFVTANPRYYECVRPLGRYP